MTSQSVTYAYKPKERDYIEVPASVESVPAEPNTSTEGATTGETTGSSEAKVSLVG